MVQQLHVLFGPLGDLMSVVFEPYGKIEAESDAVALLGGAAAKFSRNATIFSQGNRADTLFYLERGWVKMSVVSNQGKEAIITILPAGSFFGEGCLAGKNVYGSTATTLVDCSALSFKKKHVMETIRLYPKFAQFFVIYTVRQKVRVEEDLADQLLQSSEKRLARVLLLLVQSGHDESQAELIANVSQETLARMIGTTRSRVNFFMNKFRRLGFVDYKDGLRVHPSRLSLFLHD